MADIKVKVGQKKSLKVVSAFSGDASISIAGLSDVNAGTLQSGMVLVYNATTSKWDATLELTPGTTQNLDINGGNF